MIVAKDIVDEATSELDAVRDEWMSRPGVTSVDVGFKVKDGDLTEEVSIRVHVTRKIAVEDLPEEEVFNVSDEPDRLLGEFPIDVIQCRYKPMAARDTFFNPLVGGISCSLETAEGAGTLGAIVFDNLTGKPMVLSNWHVIADGVEPGADIYQPGSPSVVAHLTRSVLDERMDAAVAILKFDSLRDYSPYIYEVGTIVGVEEPALGMLVIKSGRMTGVTAGIIDGVNASVEIDYEGELGELIFTDQIKVSPRPPWPDIDPLYEFVAGGDSGSVIINEETMNAVALLFAGNSETIEDPEEGESASCSPITTVADELDFSFLPQPESPPTGAVSLGIGWREALGDSGVYNWTVPPLVDHISIALRGGGGAGSQSFDGSLWHTGLWTLHEGRSFKGIPVHEGDTITVVVGGSADPDDPTIGGLNGGGMGATGTEIIGGGGGGCTEIYRNEFLIAVAPGSGGGTWPTDASRIPSHTANPMDDDWPPDHSAVLIQSNPQPGLFDWPRLVAALAWGGDAWEYILNEDWGGPANWTEGMTGGLLGGGAGVVSSDGRAASGAGGGGYGGGASGSARAEYMASETVRAIGQAGHTGRWLGPVRINDKSPTYSYQYGEDGFLNYVNEYDEYGPGGLIAPHDFSYEAQSAGDGRGFASIGWYGWKPIAVINGPTTAPFDVEVTYDGNASGDYNSGGIPRYDWRVIRPDSSVEFFPDQGSTFDYTFPELGSYGVSLTVFNEDWLQNTAELSVSVVEAIYSEGWVVGVITGN